MGEDTGQEASVILAAATPLEEAEELIEAVHDDRLGVVEEESTGTGGSSYNS